MTTSQFKWVGLLWMVLLAGVTGAQAQSGDLVTYHNVTLVEHPVNDGDSFFVQAGDKKYHIRLYFVDSPETDVYQLHDARRVQEQARYFGLTQPERVMWLGAQAKAFTKEVLSRPFTLYTSHARALGGATSYRIYGFIVTSNGRDLGELLVENGLARNFGVKRERYDGISHAEMDMRLRDMEISAMLARRGVWSESDPNRIVEFRAQQRAEQSAMQTIMTSSVRLLEEPLDINHASQRDLERIPGIGPVTAGRIINQRPFRTLDDVIAVPGVGAKTLDSIRPYIRIDEPVATNG